MLRIATILAITLGLNAQELLTNGDFNAGDLSGWTLEGCNGTTGPVAGREAPSATLVPEQDFLQASQLFEGVAGKVLIIRGSILLREQSNTTQVWTMSKAEDWSTIRWTCECIIGPSPEWQDFAAVVPVPAGTVRMYVGVLHRGTVPVVIDDWSATIREP